MCGIVGAIHFNQQPVRADMIEQMANTLKHRDPDDAGVFVDRMVGLGHRRLKIIDLSPAGHQPMCNEDGTVRHLQRGDLQLFGPASGAGSSRPHIRFPNRHRGRCPRLRGVGRAVR